MREPAGLRGNRVPCAASVGAQQAMPRDRGRQRVSITSASNPGDRLVWAVSGGTLADRRRGRPRPPDNRRLQRQRRPDAAPDGRAAVGPGGTDQPDRPPRGLGPPARPQRPRLQPRLADRQVRRHAGLRSQRRQPQADHRARPGSRTSRDRSPGTGRASPSRPTASTSSTSSRSPSGGPSGSTGRRSATPTSGPISRSASASRRPPVHTRSSSAPTTATRPPRARPASTGRGSTSAASTARSRSGRSGRPTSPTRRSTPVWPPRPTGRSRPSSTCRSSSRTTVPPGP